MKHLLLLPLLYSTLTLTLVTAIQLPFTSPPPPPTPPPPSQLHTLTLRQALHISTTNRSLPILHRHYTPSDHTFLSASTGHSTTQSLTSLRTLAYRPSSPLAFQAARRSSYFTPRAIARGVLPTWSELEDELLGNTLEWDEQEVLMPNVTDVKTLNSLAKMAANAYANDQDGGVWWDLEGKWNVSDSFGWVEDGLRGHIFADPTNSTVVVSIKGTTAPFIGGGGNSGRRDKINDNLLFSCCCARVDWSWTTVCDCYSGSYTCQQDCLEHSVMTDLTYYPVATDLYNNITALYPHAQIWLVGHSLGGSLAALLSRTYGIPSVSFEAVGDRLAAQRLHLPFPPSSSTLSLTSGKPTELTTHVFHTADPIAMGVCTGTLSTCGAAGFALEARCHMGRNIVYDTVGKLGWSVDIRTHSIKVIIEQVLVEDWGVTKGVMEGVKSLGQRLEMKKRRGWGWWPLPGGGGDKDDPDDDPDDGGKKKKKEPDDGQNGGRGVPEPTPDDGECVDCFKWTFE